MHVHKIKKKVSRINILYIRENTYLPENRDLIIERASLDLELEFRVVNTIMK